MKKARWQAGPVQPNKDSIMTHKTKPAAQLRDPLAARAHHFRRTAQGIAAYRSQNAAAASSVRELLEMAVRAGSLQ
jgi:hypothetical protein